MRTPFKTTDSLATRSKGIGLTPIIEDMNEWNLLSSNKKYKDDSDTKAPRHALLEEEKKELEVIEPQIKRSLINTFTQETLP